MLVAAHDGFYRAGLAALAAGDPAGALPLLGRAAEAGEGGAFAWLNLGQALTELGRLNQAVEPLERAAAALPHLADPRVRLGQILGLRGEAEAAAAHFRAALGAEPDNVVALAGLAVLEENAGRLDAAQAVVVRARAADP